MINEKDITNALEQMSKKLTMTDAENARVARVLQEHMFHNPIRQTPKIPSPYTSVTLWLGRVAVVGAIALVVTGSTLIAAANQALPGDTLYGFKVGVNEEIQSFLKPTPAARLAFESQRTEERLNEAQALIVRGDFTPEAQETIKKNIEKHSQEITRQAQELATIDPETYEEVTLLAQTSLARKAEETKALAEESLLDPETHDAVILATLTVTEQVAATLTIADEQADESSLGDENEALPIVTPEPIKNNPQYLAYLMDDTQTRLRILKEQEVAEQKEAEVMTTATVATTATKQEAPQAEAIAVATTPETKLAAETKTATVEKQESGLDLVALGKKVSELQALRTKITELRSMEPLPTERITKNINLFLELATEIYNTLGTELPDPLSILPKTNGVVIPTDLTTPSVSATTPTETPVVNTAS